MRGVTTAPIPPAWVPALEGFEGALRAGGSPKTTIGTRMAHMRRLARTIGVSSPWDVNGDQLTQWAGRQDWAVETRRGYRQSMLSFWRWAIAAERTDTNPADLLPVVTPSVPKPRPAPEIAYREALRRADQRDQLILRLAAECGMRRAEVAQAHRRDLIEDMLGWSIVVHGKGSRERIVPLPDGLAADLLAFTPRGYFFPGNDDGHLSPRWVGKIVSTLLPGDCTMHRLRHRFASKAYQYDRDTFTVQELLGHASPATTRRYVAVPNESLRATVDAVANSSRARAPRGSEMTA